MMYRCIGFIFLEFRFIVASLYYKTLITILYTSCQEERILSWKKRKGARDSRARYINNMNASKKKAPLPSVTDEVF